MATQLAPTFAYSPPEPKPHVRVAYVAGEAVQAVSAALAKLPAETQASSVEALTLTSMAEGLIADAKRLLSDDIYTSFLEWAYAASLYQTLAQTDEELSARGDACEVARFSVMRARGQNEHDFAVKSFVLAIEAGEDDVFGPLDGSRERTHRIEIIAVAMHDAILAASPVTAGVQDLATLAWRYSGPKSGGYTVEVGAALTRVFSYALALDRVERDGRLTTADFASEYERLAASPSSAWRAAVQRFETADREMRDYEVQQLKPLEERVLALKSAKVQRPDPSELRAAWADYSAHQEHYDLLVAVQDETLWDMVRTPAPDTAALATKMKACIDDRLFSAMKDDEAEQTVLRDAQRLAGSVRSSWSPANVAWNRARAEYEQLREIGDKDGSGDSRVDAYCDAMDRLIVATPAPDAAALKVKMELALERCEGFGFFEEYGAAIIRDLDHFAAPDAAPDPICVELDKRNALVERLNRETEMPEGELDRELARLNDYEAVILGSPAVSSDGLLAKMIMAAQIVAEGHELSEDISRSLVAEAISLVGHGWLHRPEATR